MKIGGGFGFNLAQAILYTLAAAVLLILGAVYAVFASDYMGCLFESNYNGTVHVYGCYIDGTYIDSDNYNIIKSDDGQIYLEISVFNGTTSETEKTIIPYEKAQNSSERIIFSDGSKIVEVSYNDVYNYSWDEYNVLYVIFLAVGGFMSVFTILQFVVTFKGRKSKKANDCGIALNFLFALGAYGLCGLVGCIKGRMYQQFTKTGYVPLQPQADTVPVQRQVAEAAVAQTVANAEEAEDSGVTQNLQGETEKRYIKKSDFKLDLYDASIDEKTWKQFKKTASQDELAVIAIGAKYKVAHGRIKNLIYALGIILSIAVFWPTGGWSLIAYPVFAFLATKAIRYEDTLSQTYRKLNKEYRQLVDGYFNCGIGWIIYDFIVKIGVFWLTIPYQAILLFIGLFAPNFVISKNGILVSIPKGYDVGALGAVGEYYASFSFMDEALANANGNVQTASSADDYYKRDEYTYTDSHGYEQTVYSGDGKEFYDTGGHYAGSSDENGGKFKKED